MQTVNSRNPKSKHTDASLPDLMPNTPVSLDAGGKTTFGQFRNWTRQNDAYIVGQDGKQYWRKLEKFQVTGDALPEEYGTIQVNGAQAVAIREIKPMKTFNINTRFEFLSRLVRMTIKKQNVSLIITGDGGLGKTKTAMQEIEAAGLVEGMDLKVIKGYSTAKGLYNTLFENQDKLIIFDDCDEILTNDVARNILKGALDSYDKRIVHWVTNNPSSDVPSEFEFKGQIIFISNMNRSRIPQALISRSTCIDVSMTTGEKIERMRKVLDKVCPEVDLDMKQEALSLVEKWKNETRDLNFRTLIKVINIRKAAENEDDWKEMAEYMLLS